MSLVTTVAQAVPLDLPNVEYSRFLPILILIGGALGILVVAATVGRRVAEGWWTTLSVTTAAAAGLSAVWLWNDIQQTAPGGNGTAVAGALRIDGFAIWFALLICSAVVLFSLMADGYVQRERLGGPELHVLALLSASGGVLMAYANDLLVLFLGLEILSIALYVMAGYHRRRQESGEAAMKYFVLGAFSSAIFLYGVALMYGATGSTRFDEIYSQLDGGGAGRSLALAGMAMMIVGLGFKVAAVPFHTWTPDVYQGSPSPVTGFMAAAAKAAGFAGLIRVMIFGLLPLKDDWRPAVWALAVLSLVAGSVLAIVQTDVKRMLAYSSISHAGYVLIGVYAANPKGLAGAQYYLMTYAFTVLGSFAIVSVVARRGDAATSVEDYRGLGTKKPVLALAFTILLAAQAGVPLTTGFLAKFSVIQAATSADDYSLAVVAMLVTAVASFFYLRLIITIYAAPAAVDEAAPPSPAVRIMPATAATIAVSVAMTVGGALWAGPLLDFAERASFLFGQG